MTRTGGSITGGGSGSGSLADSGRPTKGGSKSASRDTREVGEAHLCTFVVNGQGFALTTMLVRELVEVTSITKVPRTDDSILGLFNLRGEPMPLVDMSMLLGLGTTASPPSDKMQVIIIRSEGMSVGARIDALGTVVPNAGLLSSNDPSPLLLGFLPPRGNESSVAVINPSDLMSRLERLKRTTSERE